MAGEGVAERERFKLEISPDRMQVTLCVMDATERAPLTEEVVLAAVTALGVRYGVDRGAIGDAIRATDGRKRIIARGRSPLPGVDGHLRWLVQVDRASRMTDGQGDGPDQVTPMTVETGVKLAVVVPPTPGRPGINVYGDVVPVDPPLLCKVVAGAGSELQGDTVISTRAGRPVETVVGSVMTVKVLPMYHHAGFVDMSSGHLNVNGDLLITGSITAGMEVHAEGSVTIRGHVLQAEVRAGGTITVEGNAIGSTLVAGGRQAFYRTILPSLIALDTRLGDLTLVIGQILRDYPLQVRQLQPAGIGPLLDRMLETAFADVPTSAQALADEVAAAGDRKDELAQLLGIMLHSRLLGKKLLGVRDLSELTQVRQLLTRLQKTMELEIESRSAIVVPYCEQSTLRSNGTIRVGQRGTYHSDLIAYQHITVQGPVLGGSLTSHGSIDARVLGSESGVPTDATVGSWGRIRAVTAHPGVTVRVGSFMSQVRVRGPLDVQAESMRQSG